MKPKENTIKSGINEQSVDETQRKVSYENTNETNDSITETNYYDDDPELVYKADPAKQEMTPFTRNQRSVKQSLMC